jgi:hypothetical protein
MTKKWSTTRSGAGTKRQASHAARRKADTQVEKYLKEQGAVESVSYDEETGRPMQTLTIDLTKHK